MTRREDNLHLEIALLLSLLLHAFLFGCWQYRATLGHVPFLAALAKALNPPRILSTEKSASPRTITFVQIEEPAKPKEQVVEKAQRLMETDSAQVTGEQPKEAEFYSDKATVAANPANPTKETADTPYLDGTEKRVMSTVDVLSPAGAPAAAPPMPVTPPAPSAVAKPVEPAKEMPAAKPVTTEKPKELPAEGLRVMEDKIVAMLPKQQVAPQPPVTVPQTAAPSQPSASGREIVALKSQLKATGSARSGIAAFNVAESPFGAYDKKIVRAVQSRWFALIERYALYERAGTVTLHFQLEDDGTVINLRVADNSAGVTLGLFCEKAVVDSAPFEPLPEQLRLLVGREPRDVNFTFYY